MKPLTHSRSRFFPVPLAALPLLLALAGCRVEPSVDAANRAPAPPAAPPVRLVKPASQVVVEQYLDAAKNANGERMHALIAAGERQDESPKSLRKTAADRYSASTTWEVLKAEENGSTGEVVLEFRGAKVESNPVKFTLTRENGEWRIVDSPELHEREKDGGLHIRL